MTQVVGTKQFMIATARCRSWTHLDVVLELNLVQKTTKLEFSHPVLVAFHL